ncbi:TetR/AcrR family transcriptional regulator [Actinoplanes sp. CA-051413]|uniref:TetR/AcrR family transcriptional regulator n=1 Tax=Actinoplanes sp. CA-051413 TaxID=3239899 RepID=UPI003D98E234
MSYREEKSRQLREAIVDAARSAAVSQGWAAVKMADVADAVGVSRQTVYNEFGNKAGVAEALTAREVSRFVDAVRAELLAHGGDIRAAGEAAILRTLTEAADNPLVKAILTGTEGDDGLLPYLTTRSELVLTTASAVVRDWASAHVPEAGADTVAAAAESIVRLVLSHVVLPSAPAEQTAAVLADTLVRLLR